MHVELTLEVIVVVIPISAAWGCRAQGCMQCAAQNHGGFDINAGAHAPGVIAAGKMRRCINGPLVV